MNQNVEVEMDPHHDSFIDHRRIQLASKISMDDEEELLGILQTKGQMDSEIVDDEIVNPIQDEFDSYSVENNRDIDLDDEMRINKGILNINLDQSLDEQNIDGINVEQHTLANEYPWGYDYSLSIDEIQSSDQSHRNYKDSEHQSFRMLCDFDKCSIEKSFNIQCQGVDDETQQNYRQSEPNKNDDVYQKENTPLAPRRLRRSSTRERESVENYINFFLLIFG